MLLSSHEAGSERTPERGFVGRAVVRQRQLTDGLSDNLLRGAAGELGEGPVHAHITPVEVHFHHADARLLEGRPVTRFAGQQCRLRLLSFGDVADEGAELRLRSAL